jgi:predicted membrane channel-forming protein YqfA (hemolysin III family)
MKKLPRARFHLVFSVVMGAMMISLMTFVITLVNVGWVPDFTTRWLRAFLVAYAVGVPVIYFLAPLARKLTARFVEAPPA